MTELEGTLAEHTGARAYAAIPTAVHYPVPIHAQPAYAHLSYPDSCPVALAMVTKVMRLPMGPYLSPDCAREVAAILLRAAHIALPKSEPATTTRL